MVALVNAAVVIRGERYISPDAGKMLVDGVSIRGLSAKITEEDKRRTYSSQSKRKGLTGTD